VHARREVLAERAFTIEQGYLLKSAFYDLCQGKPAEQKMLLHLRDPDRPARNIFIAWPPPCAVE
jgi:hypothetical protein